MWNALKRFLFGPPSMAEVRAEYQLQTASWRCRSCGLPKPSMTKHCPSHMTEEEKVVWKEWLATLP